MFGMVWLLAMSLQMEYRSIDYDRSFLGCFVLFSMPMSSKI